MKKNSQKIKVTGFIRKNPYAKLKKTMHVIFKNKPAEYNGYIAVRDDIWIVDKYIGDYGYDELDELFIHHNLVVHGGFTFKILMKNLKDDIDEFVGEIPKRTTRYIVFGWDYMHTGDNLQLYPKEKIINEVKQAIEDMEKLINYSEFLKLPKTL